MVAVKAQIPMSGTVIQEAALNAEFLRLGKETSQSATDEAPGDRASINESFENLRDILHGATNNFVGKSSGCKVNDKLFLAQLRMAASTDKESQGDLSETGMLIWKTKDLDSKKALFARELRAKGVQDATLTASQSKSFCVGDWHYNQQPPVELRSISWQPQALDTKRLWRMTGSSLPSSSSNYKTKSPTVNSSSTRTSP